MRSAGPTEHGSNRYPRAPMSTPSTSIGRAVLWVARVVWLVVAVLGGSAFGTALSSFERPVQVTGTIGLWAGWGVVALALLVPSTVGLTAIRVLVPVGLAASLATLFGSPDFAESVACIAPLVVMCLLVGSGELGELFAQASAYGDERRFPLRAPAAFIVPTVVSWTLWCATAIAGPLLLAGGIWAAGVPIIAIALVLTWFLPRRFHRLSRRWLVLVPAGVVVHDHVVLMETVMLPRPNLRSLHLAFADTEAADLTGPAAGHALELELREMATVVLTGNRDKPTGAALHVRSLLVAPSRPGRALAAAAARGLPVG